MKISEFEDRSIEIIKAKEWKGKKKTVKKVSRT